eukprot:6172971-Pleurochrysis_carterae.AAC.1
MAVYMASFCKDLGGKMVAIWCAWQRDGTSVCLPRSCTPCVSVAAHLVYLLHAGFRFRLSPPSASSILSRTCSSFPLEVRTRHASSN